MAVGSEVKKFMGDPWQLFTVGNIAMIGLASILFMLVLQVAGMGLHRLMLWRVTGSASGKPIPYSPAAVAAQTTETN